MIVPHVRAEFGGPYYRLATVTEDANLNVADNLDPLPLSYKGPPRPS